LQNHLATRKGQSSDEKAVRQRWRTPRPFAEAMANRFSLDLDAAALPENSVCDRMIVPTASDAMTLPPAERQRRVVAIDALGARPWWCFGNSIWVNPPFSQMALFVDKIRNDANAFRSVVSYPVKVSGAIGARAAELRLGYQVVMLGPANLETVWARNALEFGASLEIVTPRLAFEVPRGVEFVRDRPIGASALFHWRFDLDGVRDWQPFAYCNHKGERIEIGPDR
jgi:hypothetical protein